jgi:uncharacterized linocin/CFP29 family protein
MKKAAEVRASKITCRRVIDENGPRGSEGCPGYSVNPVDKTIRISREQAMRWRKLRKLFNRLTELQK